MFLSLVFTDLCMYGLAGMIGCQFIVQDSDIFWEAQM